MSFSPSNHLDFPSLEKVRVVALDAVGTVMDPVPAVGEAYHHFGLKHGSRKSVEEVTAAFKRAFAATESRTPRPQQPETDPWWTSEEEEYRRWENIVAMVLDDLPDHRDCFREIHDYFGLPSAWSVFPDVAPTIDALSARGLRVVLASNFDNRLHAVCRGTSELNAIRGCFVSAELGARKPSLGFYRRLLERLQLSPQELLMVGDDLQNDVLPLENWESLPFG